MPDVSTLSPQYRPNIAHLATIFVSLSDSCETHLSTGRVRKTFASKGKRRAIRDDLGEVKGPRDTSSYNPPAAAAFPRAGRANGTVGAEQKGRHIARRRSQLEWRKSTALDCALYVRNIGRWRPATSSWDCLRGRPQTSRSRNKMPKRERRARFHLGRPVSNAISCSLGYRGTMQDFHNLRMVLATLHRRTHLQRWTPSMLYTR